MASVRGVCAWLKSDIIIAVLHRGKEHVRMYVCDVRLKKEEKKRKRGVSKR
jgi:hypothetical protein